MDIAIIGAGIAGLTTAWRLHSAGHRVTVFEASEAPAQGASHANGGQLSYRYVAPLAEKSVLFKLPGWLLDSESPVRWRPRLEKTQWLWLREFIHATSRRQYRYNREALLDLAGLSRQTFDRLRKTPGIEFGFQQNGKLIVHRDTRQFRAARRQLKKDGYDWESCAILNAAECIDAEPALQPLQKHIAGAIHLMDEQMGDCRALCESLAAHLLAEPPQARMMYALTVRELDIRNGRVVALLTDEGRFATDAVVLATGIKAPDLIRPTSIPFHTPIYGVKGYSIDLEVPPTAPRLQASVTDFARKILYAPLNGQLRVAGMADIVGLNNDIDPARIDTLRGECTRLLGDWVQQADYTSWAGLRPATPSGRPVIGQAPGISNLWYNFGHGALGFTLAAGSAQLLYELIDDQPLSINSDPFTPPGQ